MESTAALNTPAKFRRVAEQAFRNSNPEAATTSAVVFNWIFCNRVRWADGSAGFSGKVEIQAPGFKPRSFIASFSHDAVTVR